MLKYRTSRPVVTNKGITSEPSFTELMNSLHPEVRQGAANRRPFVFGGTKFSPIPYAETPTYGRLRLTSLPGFPAPKTVTLSDLLAIADRSGRVANGGKTPTPQTLRKISPARESTGSRVIKPSRVKGRSLIAPFILLVCAALGIEIGYLLTRTNVGVFVESVMNRRTGINQ